MLNGTYTILNLPPGDYTITAAMLGYGKTSTTEVRVEIDRTARVDFELAEEEHCW